MKNNLRKIREKRGLTQEELANKSGISRVTISKLESQGTGEIKLSTMQALGRALSASMEEIFFKS